MSAALMRGLTRSPATGSVVRCMTVNTSTLATIRSGIETSSRRRTNRSIGCSSRKGPAGGRSPPAGPQGLLQRPVVHVEEAAVARRGVGADRPGEPVVVPHQDERLLEHRDPREVLALQLVDLLD